MKHKVKVTVIDKKAILLSSSSNIVPILRPAPVLVIMWATRVYF